MSNTEGLPPRASSLEPTRRLVIYLIGPEPDGVYIISSERQRLIRESDLCMQIDHFFSPGDTIVVDEKVIQAMRSVKTGRGGVGIAYGTVLRAVEIRAHGKQVVFVEHVAGLEPSASSLEPLP